MINYNIGDKVIYTNNNGKIVWRGSIIDLTRDFRKKSKQGLPRVIYMIMTIQEDNGLVRSVAEEFVSLDKEFYREQKLKSILND